MILRIRQLPRWTGALALALLLLAAQQLAWRHPLSHLNGAAHGTARAHDDAPASNGAEVACSLCLAGATASALAVAASLRVQALPLGAPVAAGTVQGRRVVRAPSCAHNRGPPPGA